jgi:hypothetical protein
VVAIADCGRLDSTSPAWSIAREADRVLLLARPRADELTHLAASLSMVDLWSLRPDLTLVGPGYPAGEVARALGMPVRASIPQDPKGARVLCGHSDARRGLARSALGKAARRISIQLTSPHTAAGGAELHPLRRQQPVEQPAARSTTAWHTRASAAPESSTHNGTSLEGWT